MIRDILRSFFGGEVLTLNVRYIISTHIELKTGYIEIIKIRINLNLNQCGGCKNMYYLYCVKQCYFRFMGIREGKMEYARF